MKTLKFLLLITPLGFILSCSSNKLDKETMSTSADSQSATGLKGASLKLVKTGSIDFKVADVHKSAREIARTVRSLNGIISDRNIGSIITRSKELQTTDDSMLVVSSFVTKGEMLVRIPSAKLDTFVEQIYNNATFINNISIQIDDKSLDYLAAKMKQQNRMSVLEQKNVKPLDAIEQKDQITDDHIANMQTDANVNFSFVQLSFSQNPVITKEKMMNIDFNSYTLPFGKAMSDSFSDGWKYFLRFIIGITNFWMFVLAGLLITYGVKYFHKIKKVAL